MGRFLSFVSKLAVLRPVAVWLAEKFLGMQKVEPEAPLPALPVPTLTITPAPEPVVSIDNVSATLEAICAKYGCTYTRDKLGVNQTIIKLHFPNGEVAAATGPDSATCVALLLTRFPLGEGETVA